jgi:hypothetical protein
MKPVKNVTKTTRLIPIRAAPRAGQIIGERYRLEELLERGAMGSVWRAEQIRLRAPAAVKFLDPSLIGDPEMHDRFMQEARSAAAVRSVHVVQVLDYGSDGAVPYIAMELLEGENLDARLSSRGTLTPSELNKIFTEVARGIGQAHAMGVIHRDVKPGNIFIAREGEHEVTKLIDFGIAKVKADALKCTQIVGTQLGTLLGTPQYMSPEQVRGSSLLDHRTDLWALAIIACECLTGRYPFSGTSLGDLTVQICTEKPRAPSSLGQVPAGFDQWFFKGTSKKAFRRFESVEEMAAALTKILLLAGGAPATSWSERLRGLTGRIEVGRAWVSTGSHVRQLSLLARQGLCSYWARLAILVTSVRAQGLAVARSERLRFWRPLWTREGLLASVLLILVSAFALSWLPSRGGEGPDIPAGVPAQMIQAASPAPPSVALAPLLPADEEVLAVLPPALDDMAPPEAAEAAPAPEQGPAPRRADKRARAVRAGERAPLGPMGAAMGQAGARILQGNGKRNAAPATAPAAVKSRVAPSETSVWPQPAPPAPQKMTRDRR